jgi:hypothetical protein
MYDVGRHAIHYWSNPTNVIVSPPPSNANLHYGFPHREHSVRLGEKSLWNVVKMSAIFPWDMHTEEVFGHQHITFGVS